MTFTHFHGHMRTRW